MWVWVNSRSWWWTGRPGVLQFMGSQRVGHDWANELHWTDLNWKQYLAVISTTFSSLFTLLWSVAFITSNNGTDGKYTIGLNMYDRRTPFLYFESWQQMLWSLDEVKTLWKWDTKRFPRLLAALREEILIRERDSTVFTLTLVPAALWSCSVELLASF